MLARSSGGKGSGVKQDGHQGGGVALVTGANGAIGEAIARGLAERGFVVVLACRNERAGDKAAEAIRRSTGNSSVRLELVDVSRRASIEALAARWEGGLDVLVNNAAVAPRHREETPEGIERQLATNVLGYLWMSEVFADPLAGSEGRIVNVASYWAGGLELDDLEFKRRRYDNDAAYRQSKQADRMLTVGLAERLRPRGVSVNACHPGDVRSQLSGDLGFGGHQSAESAAETPLYLALEPAGAEHTGDYFANCRPERCRFGEDRAAVATLLERLSAYSSPTQRR